MRLPEKPACHRSLEYDGLWAVDVDRQQQQISRAGNVGECLANLGQCHDATGMLVIVEQPRKRQPAKARIGAGEEFARPDRGLDGAEPQSLGLALLSAELAGGIYADLHAAVGGLLQLRLVDLDEFVLHVVDRLGREFHRDLLRVRWRGGKGGRDRGGCGDTPA